MVMTTWTQRYQGAFQLTALKKLKTLPTAIDEHFKDAKKIGELYPE